MEFQIRFWLVFIFCGFAFATVWYGHIWRTWLGWLEYVIGGLLIVGATSLQGQAGLLTTWQDCLLAMIWNYCCATPVIIGWILKAALDEARNRHKSTTNEREYLNLLRGDGGDGER